MAEEGADPLLGKVLSGRFQILSPLGKGGMGRVYKALQKPLNRVVALKVLNPNYDSAKDPGFERRFFLEASMTARLKHPNTITVHDYGRTDDGIFFIAMEYLEGETLGQELLRAKRLPWQRALSIGGQIARSLREAHKLGLVHRDLKPANIMLLGEGTAGDVVKVLDFGLVKPFTPEDSALDVDITQKGVLLGSPLYMAPEQARGEADPRTDIYALGVLLFQCIAGRPPFDSKDSIEVIVQHLKEKPPELRSLAPDVPAGVNAVIMKCLAKKPAERFQSMDELLEAMRNATAGQGLSGLFADRRTSSGPFPRTSSHPDAISVGRGLVPRRDGATALRSRPSVRKALYAGLAALFVAAAGVGGFLAFRAGPAPVPVVNVAPLGVPPPAAAPLLRERPVEPALVEVTFEVESEPPGATVTRDGKPLGTAPLTLSVARVGAAPAKVELTFSLEGFESASLVAQGTAGSVPVRQSLKRKKASAPKRDEPSDDFKGDPYQ